MTPKQFFFLAFIGILSSCNGQNMGKKSLQYKYSKGIELNADLDSVYPELASVDKGSIVQDHSSLKYPGEFKMNHPLRVVHVKPATKEKYFSTYKSYYDSLKEDLSEFNVGSKGVIQSTFNSNEWSEVKALTKGHLVLLVDEKGNVIRSLTTADPRISVEPAKVRSEVFHLLFDMRNGSKERPYFDLSDFESYVLNKKGTERAYTGEYWNHKADGIYLCRKCHAPLYWSRDKFDSHCGWPSFDDEISVTVTRRPDVDGFRTEIICTNCKGHLGHVFLGEGFTEKDTRHCVNSVSIEFKSFEDK